VGHTFLPSNTVAFTAVALRLVVALFLMAGEAHRPGRRDLLDEPIPVASGAAATQVRLHIVGLGLGNLVTRHTIDHAAVMFLVARCARLRFE
jgi:hypothetical protein